MRSVPYKQASGSPFRWFPGGAGTRLSQGLHFAHLIQLLSTRLSQTDICLSSSCRSEQLPVQNREQSPLGAEGSAVQHRSEAVHLRAQPRSGCQELLREQRTGTQDSCSPAPAGPGQPKPALCKPITPGTPRLAVQCHRPPGSTAPRQLNPGAPPWSCTWTEPGATNPSGSLKGQRLHQERMVLQPGSQTTSDLRH